MQDFQVIDVRGAVSLIDAGARIAASCRNSRLTLVRAPPHAAADREYWDEVLNQYGERAAVDEETASGRALDGIWSTVEFDPERQDRFRHSKSAQPLHTDGAYVHTPPPIIFLVCSKPAPSGGATLFLDYMWLINELNDRQPELLTLLRSVPVIFSKGGVDVESTVIDDGGNMPSLRWNYYAVSSANSTEVRAIAERFREFLEEMAVLPMTLSLPLQQGEAVFFHDAQLLHGRESFTARFAGDRCLLKGGIRFK